MTDTPTTSAPQAPQTSADQPIIKSGSLGKVDLNAFREVSGVNAMRSKMGAEDDSGDEAAPSDGGDGGGASEEDSLLEAAAETEGSEGDPEADKEEDPDSLLSLDEVEPATDKRNIRLKTKDGKEFKIPPDATIVTKVDGELKEINIREAINAKVGEFSYEKAKSELEARERQVVAERDDVKNQFQRIQSTFKEVADLSVSEKPELAIAKLAEFKGVPPGKVMKDMILLGLKWAKNFQDKGLTLETLDGLASQMNEEFYQNKLKERDTEEKKVRSEKTVAEMAEKAKKDYGLTDTEFAHAMKALVDEKAYEGRELEDCIKLTTVKALGIKHDSLIQEALKPFPKIQKNTKFIAALKNHTDPIQWKVEDIQALIREYAKPGQSPKPQSNGSAPNRDTQERQSATRQPAKSEVVKGYAGLRKASGLKARA